MSTTVDPQPRIILIVEDDVDTASALADLVRIAGHQAITMANGQEGLRYLEAHFASVCIVILDLMMPVMDGWELRKRMLADARLRSIPVIVTTGNKLALEKAEQAQVRLFVTKPIEPDRLLEEIGKCC